MLITGQEYFERIYTADIFLYVLICSIGRFIFMVKTTIWFLLMFTARRSNQPQDHSVYGLSQWNSALQCHVFSHWLCPYTEWSLNLCIIDLRYWQKYIKSVKIINDSQRGVIAGHNGAFWCIPFNFWRYSSSNYSLKLIGRLWNVLS